MVGVAVPVCATLSRAAAGEPGCVQALEVPLQGRFPE